MGILDELFKEISRNNYNTKDNEFAFLLEKNVFRILFSNSTQGNKSFEKKRCKCICKLLESLITYKNHEVKLLEEEILILKDALVRSRGALNIKNNSNNGHIILGNVFFVDECPCQEFSNLNRKEKDKIVEFMKKLKENCDG